MFDSMLAKPQVPCEGVETLPPFQMCRMMLDQLGLLAWEQRSESPHTHCVSETIKTLLKHPHQTNHVEGTSKILVICLL